MKTVRFQFENETPGTFRFEEIDAAGLVVNHKDPALVVGKLYMRKAAFAGHAQPRPGSRILVTIVEEAA